MSADFFFQLGRRHFLAEDQQDLAVNPADHPAARQVVVLFPLVHNGADDLVQGRLAVGIAQLVGIVQADQGRGGLAALAQQLFQVIPEHRLHIAAVVGAGEEIPVQVLPHQFPFPLGHPVFGQGVACQGGAHLNAIADPAGLDPAPQHTAHLAAALFITHLHGVILPVVLALRRQLHHADVLKNCLQRLGQLLQVLHGTSFFHSCFPRCAPDHLHPGSLKRPLRFQLLRPPPGGLLLPQTDPVVRQLV